MFNTNRPNLSELPTTQQLLRSTFIALIVATLVVVIVILPAEYAIDPTGIGRVTGLTKMGEIKRSLAEEATLQMQLEQQKKELPPEQSEVGGSSVTSGKKSSESLNKKSMTVIIKPNGTAEIKAQMLRNEKIQYRWTTNGGPLNYNVHSDPSNPSDGASYEYEKGTNVREKTGSISAVHDGVHGWFWRNRNDVDVTLTIVVEGEFSTLKQIY